MKFSKAWNIHVDAMMLLLLILSRCSCSIKLKKKMTACAPLKYFQNLRTGSTLVQVMACCLAMHADACMHQWTESSLVQIMASWIFGTKPLPNDAYQKCCLQNASHFPDLNVSLLLTSNSHSSCACYHGYNNIITVTVGEHCGSFCLCYGSN